MTMCVCVSVCVCLCVCGCGVCVCVGCCTMFLVVVVMVVVVVVVSDLDPIDTGAVNAEDTVQVDRTNSGKHERHRQNGPREKLALAVTGHKPTLDREQGGEDEGSAGSLQSYQLRHVVGTQGHPRCHLRLVTCATKSKGLRLRYDSVVQEGPFSCLSYEFLLQILRLLQSKRKSTRIRKELTPVLWSKKTLFTNSIFLYSDHSLYKTFQQQINKSVIFLFCVLL